MMCYARRARFGHGEMPACNDGSGRVATPPAVRWPRPRAVLGWCLLTFVGLQAALLVVMDRWPQLRDPEYGLKLGRLSELLAESPGRPLVLVLGSSRSGVGLDPRQIAADGEGDQVAVMFNFAQCGAGPIQQLMLLRTLLDHGIRPHHILLELHPLFLNQGCGALREERRVDVSRLERIAAETLADYSLSPARLRRTWWQSRLSMVYAQRQQLLDCFLPRFCVQRPQYATFCQINPWGWLAFSGRGKDEAAKRSLVERAQQEYRDAFPRFAVTDEPDRALRALLTLCRQQGIAVSMYLMPEGGEFRSLYPAAVRQQVAAYLNRLNTEYDFEVHDFTTAMPDAAFADSHHLLPEAVARFSTLFAREVVGSQKRDVATLGAQYVAGRSATTTVEHQP